VRGCSQALLALINGPARGLLLVLACALGGVCLFLFGYAILRFGLDVGGSSILAAVSYVPLVILFSLNLAIPASGGVGLVALARSWGPIHRG
jgi:hypothetical protein